MDAYNWEPVNYIDGVSEDHIIGIEAPLWSETLITLEDIEYMAFPRLPGHAEIGWSQAEGRSWNEYKERLAYHGLRWEAMEVNYYQSPQVPWIQF
jgi:hexosaminidase